MLTILLPLIPLFSSKVTISRLLWVLAQVAYEPSLACSQVSPVPTEQSCMSLQRLGTTHDIVGRVVKSVGHCAKVLPLEAATLVKENHGLCLRAYFPALLLHVVEPCVGRP